MSREDEAKVLPLIVKAILHTNELCYKTPRTNAERVGLFTTSLRSLWIGNIGRLQRDELPYYSFSLLTDPRFWLDAGIIARPKDHPMINALAEQALRMADAQTDDFKSSLKIMDAEINSSAALLKAAQELAKASETLADKAEKTMSPLAQ